MSTFNRYQSTKSENGRFSTTKYPNFPKRPTDLYIITREQDRLDLLSNQFYEDPRYWWVLAKANNLGKGTFDITAGIQLRIPFPITDLTVSLREAQENR
tara:strand:- start:2730 stop:3026 length:297 start_codon:yes stop_codon:yes gene_type:complete